MLLSKRFPPEWAWSDARQSLYNNEASERPLHQDVDSQVVPRHSEERGSWLRAREGELYAVLASFLGCFVPSGLTHICAAAFAAIVIVQISINTKSRETGCDQQMKKYMIIIEKLWILDPSVLDSLVLVEITGVGKWRRDRLRETDDHLPCRQITSTNRNNDYFCTICIWEPALIGLLISLQWVWWEICHDYWSGCTREAPTQRKEIVLY